MRDLLSAFLLVVIAPTLVVALFALAFAFTRFLISGEKPNYAVLLRALLYSLIVALAFPVVFSLTIGLILGPIVGFGYGVIMLLATAVATIFSFLCFFANGGSSEEPSFRELWARSIQRHD